MSKFDPALLKKLECHHCYQGWLSGTIGITFELYYAQTMSEIAHVFRQAADEYLNFIPPNTINFYCNNEDWRAFKPRSLSRLLNRFSSKEERIYWLGLAELGEAEPDEDADDDEGPDAFDQVGRYGLSLTGVKLLPEDDDVCAIRFEFPPDELERVGCDRFLAFVQAMAALAPFDSGFAGYAFKYETRDGDSGGYDWVADNALRFLAVHPQNSNFERESRHRLANVNWLTLLGQDMSAQLGGAEVMRQKLSVAVGVHPLVHGTLLRAGESPPIGDTNARALDLEPLKEVHRLSKPVLIDEKALANNVLNYFWRDPDQRLRWINRFDQVF
jgi:Protein of unknown function (DUF3396)